ncbi:MAG: transporter [Luteolibacter sp.]
MNCRRSICAALLALTAVSARGDDFMDRLDEALTFSSEDGQYRARISGLLDLEYYQLTGNAPGLIYTDDNHLFNSRLSLFLDSQLGPAFYFFSQARLDQGFDPSDAPLETRLEEYAVRWTPWEDGRFNLQVGRFATVVGNQVERHGSWENPFINAPLIYENVTRIYDAYAPQYPSDFAGSVAGAKYEYNPVIWGPSYATGLSVSGKLGQFGYAAEIKNASLSSRPESWDATDGGFSNPTLSTRISWRPDMAWEFGFSASEGAYLTDEARGSLPDGTGLSDFKQQVLGQDAAFSWGHWQIWAEVYEARFDVPNVGNADTLGYYIEAKYKFTPGLAGALRWNQQLFDDVPDGKGGEEPWGHDISRIDAAVTYRFTPEMQVKLQYSLQHEDHAEDDISQLAAGQVTVRF